MDLDALPTVLPFGETFDALIGFSYDAVGPEEVAGHFEVRAQLLDRTGHVPSGVFTAVAEGAASMGTAVAVVSDGMAASGLSNDTTVTAAVSAGRVVVRARRRAHAPDLWTWDVESADAQGRTCAVSKVLIAVRPRR
jgi:acyl-coenzyme A thioesterase PaaI-like protein